MRFQKYLLAALVMRVAVAVACIREEVQECLSRFEQMFADCDYGDEICQASVIVKSATKCFSECNAAEKERLIRVLLGNFKPLDGYLISERKHAHDLWELGVDEDRDLQTLRMFHETLGERAVPKPAKNSTMVVM